MKRDWREPWIDQMGLILTLSGRPRFVMMEAFKLKMLVELTPEQWIDLKEALRQRFTPSTSSTI